MTKKRLITTAILAAGAALTLAGCSAIAGQLQNESTVKFESKTQLVNNWGKSAPWLPSDATTISIKETPDGAPAVLLATSTEALDPSLCAETVRRSAPTFDLDGSPDPYTDTVFACGDWAVIATDSGWFGWTPNHPDEKADATNTSQG